MSNSPTQQPLWQRHCQHLAPGTPALVGPTVESLLAQLHPQWTVHAGPRLTCRFQSPDYPALLDLLGRLGALAQAEDHHPDLELVFGRLEVRLWTHSVGGLSENDFVLAAGIDRIAAQTGF